MKAKINELSIEDIIKKVGFFINFVDLRAAYKYNSSEKQVTNFENNLLEEVKKHGSFEEYLNLVNQNQNLFDKELYVFRALRLLQDAYDKLSNPLYSKEITEVPLYLYNGKRVNNIVNKNDVKKFLNNSRELLKDSDVADIEVDRKTREIKVYESRRFVGKTTKADADEKKANERLKQIEKEIGLENVVNFLQPTDLINICKYPNLGNLLAINLIENGKKIKRQQGDKVQDRAHNKEIEVTSELEKGKYFNWDEFIDIVRKNIKYIDIDKMLLLANSVFYTRYQNDFERFPFEEARQLRDFTRSVEKLIENKKVSINSYRFNSEVDFDTIQSSVESLNKHFIHGRYRDDIEINTIVKEILTGELSVTYLTEEEYRDVMHFNLLELTEIVASKPETLQELSQRGWIDENELQAIINGLETITKDQLLYLYNEKKINSKSVLEYYSSGKILLEDIIALKENPENQKELEKIVSSEELVSLYLDKNKKKEFNKYRDLYKTLKISGKNIEEKREIASEILEISDELLSEDKMQELYHMGLIPLDTYIDFIGVSAISELYSNGELKPVDARRLYDSQILTEEIISDFLKNSQIDDGKKLVLIYSTFPEKEDEDIRNDLMKYIKTTKKSSYNREGNTREILNSDVLPKQSKKFFTDPCARWNLLASLDSEYSFEYKSDGSSICYLPNMKKYIIEKLYDKDNKPAYGVATFIIDEDVYTANKDKILENDVVNRSELGKLSKSSGVKRLIHTGWSNAICKFFDIEDTSKYTEEQIKKIKKFSKQVEESKRPLERE